MGGGVAYTVLTGPTPQLPHLQATEALHPGVTSRPPWGGGGRGGARTRPPTPEGSGWARLRRAHEVRLRPRPYCHLSRRRSCARCWRPGESPPRLQLQGGSPDTGCVECMQ